MENEVGRMSASGMCPERMKSGPRVPQVASRKTVNRG